MKNLMVLLGAVCIHVNGVSFARYSPLIYDGFYDMPKSTYDHLIGDYVRIWPQYAFLSVPGMLYCRQNDPRVCMIYDTLGNLVGTRISFLKKDVVGSEQYYTDINTFKETNVFNQAAYSLDVYYTNPTTLTEDGLAYVPDEIPGVWVGLKGKLVQLPLEDPKVNLYYGWQRQACFPQMGQHYFYELNSTTSDCTKNVLFFGLYHNGGLVGYGVANYGKSSVAESYNARNWYENVPLIAAELIAPDHPACMKDAINHNELHNLHVYFVDHPYLIGCFFQ